MHETQWRNTDWVEPTYNNDANDVEAAKEEIAANDAMALAARDYQYTTLDGIVEGNPQKSTKNFVDDLVKLVSAGTGAINAVKGNNAAMPTYYPNPNIPHQNNNTTPDNGKKNTTTILLVVVGVVVVGVLLFFAFKSKK